MGVGRLALVAPEAGEARGASSLDLGVVLTSGRRTPMAFESGCGQQATFTTLVSGDVGAASFH